MAKAGKVLEAQRRMPEIVIGRTLLFSEELKTTLLHHVAKSGNVEMLRLFLRHVKEGLNSSESAAVLHEKDLLTGCDLLNYCCKECGYEIITELLPLYKPDEMAVQARNGNTCLHSLALNRRLSLVILNLKNNTSLWFSKRKKS